MSRVSPGRCALAAAAAVLATGCTSELPGSTPEPSVSRIDPGFVSGSGDLAALDTLEQAVARTDLAGVQDAAAVMAPGSGAADYFTFVAAATEASPVAALGDPDGRAAVRRTADGVEQCPPARGLESCVSFTDVAVDDEGRITDFRVDGLLASTGFATGEASRSDGGVTVSVLGSSTYVTGGLLVVARVHTGRATGRVPPDGATYRDPTGVRRHPTGRYGLSLLDDRSRTVLLTFRQVAPGGILQMTGTVDGRPGTWSVGVPTPSFADE